MTKINATQEELEKSYALSLFLEAFQDQEFVVTDQCGNSYHNYPEEKEENETTTKPARR